MNKKEFGKRIQKVRKSRGLTARMLAEMILYRRNPHC